MRISELREKTQQQYPEGRQVRQGDDIKCDACGEDGIVIDDIFFQLEENIWVCSWCLRDIEYDVIPPNCQGCGKRRNMTRANEIYPGVYFCYECLRTVLT